MLSSCLIHGTIHRNEVNNNRNWARTNAKPYAWEGGAQAGDRVSSSVEGTWRSRGHQVGQDPAMCLGNKGGQQHPGLSQQECSQVERSDYSHLLSTC